MNAHAKIQERDKLSLIGIIPLPESPIEVDMLRALVEVGSKEFDFHVLFFMDEFQGLGIPVRIIPQHQILNYRVDFLVRTIFDNDRKLEIVVECDGHDYHERTKEQASYDKARDRELQKLGFKVFRFTGSDIHQDANACAREVMEQVMEWHGRQAEEAMRAD
jgi:very-short-patch-repair endonuclease